MRLPANGRIALVLGLLALIPLPAGCSGGPGEVTAEQEHMARVLRLWRGFNKANHHPPKTSDELRSWAEKLTPKQLAEYDVEDVHEALTSPRDGEPYGIAVPGGKQTHGMGPIAYERKGLHGKHQMITNRGMISEIDEDTFSQMFPNP
jgi:hypothetical protein